MLLAGKYIDSANFQENWKYLLKNLGSWTMNTLCPSNSNPNTYPAKVHRGGSPKTRVRWHNPKLEAMQVTVSSTTDFYKQNGKFLAIYEPELHKTTWRNLPEKWKGERSQTQKSPHCTKRGQPERHWSSDERGSLGPKKLPCAQNGRHGVSALLTAPDFLKTQVLLVTHVNSFCANLCCCPLTMFSLSIYLQLCHESLTSKVIL